jgi:E3 ubiquitin-protein ligase HERC2
LETLVCGKPILDVDLLKANSVYRGCSETDPVVEYFWRALREFTSEERSMYLRFVWGRSRLPLTSKDFPMKHQIEM